MKFLIVQFPGVTLSPSQVQYSLRTLFSNTLDPSFQQYDEVPALLLLSILIYRTEIA
jgi:hypothetical protein